MYRRLKLSLALSALTLMTPAFAGPDYTTESVISEINPREYGMDVTLPQANNPVPCSWATRVRIRNEAANYQALAATLMTAAAQGRAVRVYVHQCDGDGASLGVAVRVNY